MDQPVAPYMIPIDVDRGRAGVHVVPPPAGTTPVAGLDPRQGILSESAAKLRGLGAGSTLTFSTGVDITIVGTLPDALMGDYELLVTRATGRTDRRHARAVRAVPRARDAHPSAEQLARCSSPISRSTSPTGGRGASPRGDRGTCARTTGSSRRSCSSSGSASSRAPGPERSPARSRSTPRGCRRTSPRTSCRSSAPSRAKSSVRSASGAR